MLKTEIKMLEVNLEENWKHLHDVIIRTTLEAARTRYMNQ